MKPFLLISTALTSIAAAHPGHEGHEDWPFDDVAWGLTAILAVSFFVARLVRR